jgi:hypothetical protein
MKTSAIINDFSILVCSLVCANAKQIRAKFEPQQLSAKRVASNFQTSSALKCPISFRSDFVTSD